MYSIFRTYRSDADWLALKGDVLFSWAIFNPNGPTICCVGIREIEGSDDQLEVFWRWLHFLGGESYCLGYVDGDEDLEGLLQILRHAFAQEVGRSFAHFPMVNAIPGFVVPPSGDDWSTQVRDLFASTNVFKNADWGQQMYYLTKYGDRFFARAAEEIREVYEKIQSNEGEAGANSTYLKILWGQHSSKPEFANWRPDQYQSRALLAGDVERWWETVTAPAFIRSAVSELAAAWVGAIHMSAAWVGASHMPPASRIVPFESVRDFLSSFNHPYWPANWNTETTRKSMGLTESGR